jgi:hypothetical protein
VIISTTFAFFPGCLTGAAFAAGLLKTAFVKAGSALTSGSAFSSGLELEGAGSTSSFFSKAGFL